MQDEKQKIGSKKALVALVACMLIAAAMGFVARRACASERYTAACLPAVDSAQAGC